MANETLPVNVMLSVGFARRFLMWEYVPVATIQNVFYGIMYIYQTDGSVRVEKDTNWCTKRERSERSEQANNSITYKYIPTLKASRRATRRVAT